MASFSSASRAAIVPYVAFDKEAKLPFYKQIYNGYRDLILSGILRPGQRLPSTRALAADLGISRLPVVNAFEQLLHEGYLEGRIGSGTYISALIPDELAKPVGIPAAKNNPPEQEQDRRTPFRKTPNAFRMGLPALDEFPLALWARIVSRHARGAPMGMMAYNDPRGLYGLRCAIAN